MYFEITGKIESLYGQNSGISQTTGKQWEAVSILLTVSETFGDKQVENKYNFDCFNDLAKAVNEYRRPGEFVKIKFTIRTREYNGRYYTSLSASEVSPIKQAEQAPKQPVQATVQQTNDAIPPETTDNLPF